MFWIGRSYLKIVKNAQKGIGFLEKASRKGDKSATFYLASEYESGSPIIKRDIKRSLEYYQRAVEQGDSYAYQFIRRIYYLGKGVPRDVTKARECFELARGWGKYWLGVMYSKGEGVPLDYKKVHKYFLEAVRLGLNRDKAYIAIRDLYLSVKIDRDNDYIHYGDSDGSSLFLL